jgi:nicotinate-nucleotide adenylyltransferase
VPAAHPPHKDPAAVTPYEDRFQMIEIACRYCPQFEASRLEEGDERSYTINTLRRFRRQLAPEDRLFFLIGSDAFEEIESWKDWREVLKLTEFIVVSRPGGHCDIPPKARVHHLDGLALPVSSSTIRERLAAGKATPELPPEVRNFIESRGLYGYGSRRVTVSP